VQQNWLRNTISAQVLTSARLAIGKAALAAEDRALFWQEKNAPGPILAALHEADRLWDEALGYLGDEADHWSRRCVK
jgi:hypothetical protein